MDVKTGFVGEGHIYFIVGGRGGLIGRTSASRSNGLHDQRFQYPSGAQDTFVRVFPSQHVVLARCWCAPHPVCTRTHKNVRTHVTYPVVHVRVRWIMETRK